MSTTPDAETLDSPPKKPMWYTAFFGSLAATGVGHILIGYVERGLIWLVASMGLIYLCFGLMAAWADVRWLVAAFALHVLVRIASIIDALICARKPRWMYGKWWSRAILVLVIAVISGFVIERLPYYFRDRFCEAFAIPTNSMMPTLVGSSVWGKCHQCGEPTPVIWPESPLQLHNLKDSQELAGVCSCCGALLDARAFPEVDDPPRRMLDRIVGNKTVEPRRWELVIFRFPEDPDVNFVMRLVGLPGERVELQNGEVTINGQIMSKPPHLKFLHYVDGQSLYPPGFPSQPGSGDSGNPVKLGPDEYYVLGDFSQRSNDSRLWEIGAPGHPPYAVPRDYLIGVVTHIYWPPERWRTFERAEGENGE